MKYSKCSACGVTSNLQYHHLVPRSRGGTEKEENLLTLCGACHALLHASGGLAHVSELTTIALAKKKRNGERVGRPKYGFKMFNGELVPDAGEQDIIKRIGDLHQRGLSTLKIAAELNQEGYRSRSGGRIVQSTVYRILLPKLKEERGERPNLGSNTVNGELVPDAAEQEIIKHIGDLHQRGLSTRKIVAALNQEGYRTRSGKRIAQPTVAMILRAKRKQDH